MADIFMKDYKNNDLLRKSFNQLALQTFGIKFETWYQHGYWTEKYIPYSFIENGKVIANVSVNLIDLVVNNNIKKAVQIGTVMTHPNYRNKGLSRRLMELVLEDYQNIDLFYLFANQTVLEFYPKFGFKAMKESLFSLIYTPSSSGQQVVKKMNPGIKEDLEFVYQFATNRISVSKTFGTINTAELIMFYFMNVFREDFYYLGDEQALVIYQIEKNVLHLYDLISFRKMNIKGILGKIATSQISKVVFHFQPEDEELAFDYEPYPSNNVLFVKTLTNIHLPNFFKHPITSQA